MTQIAAIVNQLLAARRDGPMGGPLLQPTEDLSGFDAVYAIQSGVMAGLGRVGGWKVGRWDAGSPLFYAPIRADLIRPAPDTRQPAECRLRGAELEVAFRIDVKLPSPGSHDFLPTLAACVTPMAVFEIVDSRLAEPKTASKLWHLADFQLNAGLVYGAALTTPWQPEDFANPQVQLTADGTDICNGPAALNTNTPFGMLADLVRDCGDHCGGVQPGQIVTTGSFTGLRFFPKGTQLTGRIANLPPVTATFAA
jgi:2-keto-4-pentenoate hydratase